MRTLSLGSPSPGLPDAPEPKLIGKAAGFLDSLPASCWQRFRVKPFLFRSEPGLPSSLHEAITTWLVNIAYCLVELLYFLRLDLVQIAKSVTKIALRGFGVRVCMYIRGGCNPTLPLLGKSSLKLTLRTVFKKKKSISKREACLMFAKQQSTKSHILIK